MKLHSIELTNVCNLKCSYCPNREEVRYPKGFLKLSHFIKALDVLTTNSIEKCIGLSVCGEPLLHPDVCEYIKIAWKYGNKVEIHTNGILLTEDLFKRLAEGGLKKLEVSIHSEKSYDKFKMVYDINEFLRKPVEVVGQVLSGNEEKVMSWVKKDKHYPLLIHPTHNWNWDKQHQAVPCRFIVNDMCCMKWDGKIVACCFDFQGDTVIGHIDNFAEVKHKKVYNLCLTCSPSWSTYQNDWWKWV